MLLLAHFAFTHRPAAAAAANWQAPPSPAPPTLRVLARQKQKRWNRWRDLLNPTVLLHCTVNSPWVIKWLLQFVVRNNWVQPPRLLSGIFTVSSGRYSELNVRLFYHFPASQGDLVPHLNCAVVLKTVPGSSSWPESSTPTPTPSMALLLTFII